MARVSTYLNFLGTTEEAINFYAKVFGTEIQGPIMRFGDMPAMENGPQLTDAEKNLIMHIELPILGGHMVMATDMLSSMGHELRIGNNTTINLEPDTTADADRLYAQLSEGSNECVPPMDMGWGYWGTCLDKYGIRWMFNVTHSE